MVFSGDLLKETYSKFKPEYTCWFDKSTWKYLDKYQVLCLQVQVSTKYFWISKCQVQVSTKYSRFCIKYQVSSTSTLLDPNPGQNRSRMCEIRLTKLSCAAQQLGIVHFYAVTEIKGLSCPLWWMRERRNLLRSTHVGYRSVIRAVASGASLKFGVQGASATNWFSRVNGARDNGIRLYMFMFPLQNLAHKELSR